MAGTVKDTAILEGKAETQDLPNARRVIARRILSILLGALLLSAAGFKIYGWSVSIVPPAGWFSVPEVQGAAIGWEILLGAWLLWGVAPFGSWVATIGTFTLLAGISGYLGWIGQATCNCFGTINASPWHAYTVDVAALVLLIVGHPRWESMQTVQDGSVHRRAKAVAYVALGVAVNFASLAGIGSAIYGSPAVALARLRGESLIISPDYVDFGAGQPGAVLEAKVTVHNWIDHPVRLIGGTKDCSCDAVTGLPITIPPGESRTIPIRIRVPSTSNGIFTRVVVLWTDDVNQYRLKLHLGCRVHATGSGFRSK